MKLSPRRSATAVFAAIALVTLSGCGQSNSGGTTSTGTEGDGSATATTTIRLSVNPAIYSFLPTVVAQKRGYFKDQNIDLKLTTIQGSSAALLPQLARGDLDVVPTIAAPGLFNSYAEGFNAKLIADLDSAKPGWGETGWLMRPGKDCQGGSAQDLKDLRGLRFDGGPPGSPVNLIARQAIEKAGLTTKDLTFTEKLATQGDFLAALKNRAVDVVSVPELNASALQAQGVACKWIPGSEIVDWSQNLFFAGNVDFLKKNPDAITRFLKAYLKGAHDVMKAGPQWTPDILQIAADFTGVPADVIQSSQAPPYFGSFGKIDMDYLQRVQQVWASAGLVPKPVDVTSIVDTSFLEAASK